jgi:hypothetical protein
MTDPTKLVSSKVLRYPKNPNWMVLQIGYAQRLGFRFRVDHPFVIARDREGKIFIQTVIARDAWEEVTDEVALKGFRSYFDRWEQMGKSLCDCCSRMRRHPSSSTTSTVLEAPRSPSRNAFFRLMGMS